jgi:hypothetical protein
MIPSILVYTIAIGVKVQARRSATFSLQQLISIRSAKLQAEEIT